MKGLMALEWVVVAYMLFTLAVVYFAYTKCPNADAVIQERVRMAIIMAALWLVYRLAPCRFTMLTRVLFQIASLGIWYPDIYEFVRMFPNCDHLFASFEQSLFGCQPALLWCHLFPSKVVSELMYLGYFSYYFIFIIPLFYYFIYRYEDFQKAAFIIIGSFFLFYLIYLFLPVSGPQFYYPAVGEATIVNGVFPEIGDYFSGSQGTLVGAGWTDGFFYHCVQMMHDAGERPIAAFPSSHVGVCVVVMALFVVYKEWKWFIAFMPFSILLFFSTVYIRAHYLIDAIGGFIAGLVIFAILYLIAEKCMGKKKKPKKMRDRKDKV